MIFLMALVIIVVRNSDLNQQLNSSIDVNEAISLTNEGLNTELDSLKTAVAGLEQNLALTENEKKALDVSLNQELERIRALEVAKQSLEKDISSLIDLKDRLSEDNLNLLSDKDRLTQENLALGQEKQQLLADSNYFRTRQKPAH